MADVEITLIHGFKVGEVLHHDVRFRELTPGDVIQAGLESERAVMTEHGYQFMMSPTMMGINTLLRQIDSIGDFKGPFTQKVINQLHREDFELLQLHAEALDKAVMEAIMQRGRNGASERDS